MTQTKRYLLFILLTPLFFLLAEWMSVFPHEYAHSSTAWMLGLKEMPFDIYYGHLNWQNVIFVTGIDENVNYEAIKQAGYLHAIGWIAIAGPFVTVLFFLGSLFLLHKEKIQKHPYWFYFIFWINLINLSELFGYVVLRSFSKHGDVGNIVFSWGISPLFIFTMGGFILLLFVWNFFSTTLLDLYWVMKLDALAMRVLVLCLSVFMLFGHGAVRMFLYSYGEFATTAGILFLLAMPVVVWLCWPKR